MWGGREVGGRYIDYVGREGGGREVHRLCGEGGRYIYYVGINSQLQGHYISYQPPTIM